MTQENKNPSSDLSLLLARREKRLRYWNEFLLKNRVNSKNTSQSKLESGVDGIKDLMHKYKSTLHKYALIETKQLKSSKDIDNYEKTLSDIERELDTLFNDKRLFTSKIGIAAIEE
jgi:hypothetical protein